MAIGNKEKSERTSVEETGIKKPLETAKKVINPVYSAREFADNAKQIFGVRRECAAAALKSAGISSCTVSKAKEIVVAFMKKEVR